MSPSSDKDEWGWHSSNHFTIGLVLDCPAFTVHAGKRFKVLINSRAAISLVHPSIYSMIEDYSKTKIVPSTVHLKTVDGSAMSSQGKATLHLCITNFKFPHTFIICDKLPDTDILFGIDIQKRYSLSYSFDEHKDGIIPVTIKGHNLKDPVGNFISNQHIKKDFIQTSMYLMEFITSKRNGHYTSILLTTQKESA